MELKISLPDTLAHRFQTIVPARERSSLLTKLLKEELKERDDNLAAACHAANNDQALVDEINEWQSFNDIISE